MVHGVDHIPDDNHYRGGENPRDIVAGVEFFTISAEFTYM